MAKDHYIDCILGKGYSPTKNGVPIGIKNTHWMVKPQFQRSWEYEFILCNHSQVYLGSAWRYLTELISTCLLLLVSFLHLCKLIVFYWTLSDSMSPQISRTFFSTLADFDDAVVCMAYTSPISNASSSFTSLLGTVQSARITIGITVNFMFNIFFSSLVRFKYFSPLIFFEFHYLVHWDSKIHYSPVFFF